MCRIKYNIYDITSYEDEDEDENYDTDQYPGFDSSTRNRTEPLFDGIDHIIS